MKYTSSKYKFIILNFLTYTDLYTIKKINKIVKNNYFRIKILTKKEIKDISIFINL
jgi:DNA repair photolyase